MPKHARLYRRGATYYHRAQVPQDIKGSYPKVEETFSLKTTDYHEAVKRLRVAAARIDRQFDTHRRELERAKEPAVAELTDAQIERIGEIYHAFLLEEDEGLRLDGFEGQSFEEHADDIEATEELNRHSYARGQDPDGFFRGEAEEVLGWTNVDIKLAETSDSWKRLTRRLQEASLKASQGLKDRKEGKVVETPKVAEPVVHDAPMLSDAISFWIAEKSRSTWVQKTADDHRIWSQRFIDIVGDRPISTYRKADARKFKDLLLKLPANWTRHSALKNLTFEQACEKAASLDLPPMSVTNFNKVIGFIAAFWNWARQNYDEVRGSLFEGMKLTKTVAAHEERDPFTIDELNRLFRAPLYSGCKSSLAWQTPGQHVASDIGLYWVPLLSLFTGARSGELIQLYVSDIKHQDGVDFIDINKLEDDKRLKTRTSKRRIPIHNAMKDLGFLKFVEAAREKELTRLFPEMTKGKDGYYSSTFSRKFRRILVATGIKTEKKTFHSFRHTFEDGCRDSDIPREFMHALQGHSEGDMGDRYGRGGHSLTKLNEHLQNLSYPGLKLEHLLGSGDDDGG